MYKYTAPASANDDKPDERGITQTMLDFDSAKDVEIQVRLSSPLLFSLLTLIFFVSSVPLF